MSEHTGYCHNCGVALNEPSAFCSSCGAPLAEPHALAAAAVAATNQPPSRQHVPMGVQGPERTRMSERQAQAPLPRESPPAAPPSVEEPGATPRRWIPFAAVSAAATLVAALVAILLLTVGGSAGKDVKSNAVTREQALALLAANGTTTVSSAAPGLFAFVTTGKLTTIIPAGWRATSQTTNSATRAEFADPKHPGSTVTIVAQSATPASNHGRAAAAMKAVKVNGGVVISSGAARFAGGRDAWQLTYTDHGNTHQTYFYLACNAKTAMIVDVAVAAQLFPRTQGTLAAVAASAEPSC
jgi:zinc ribbon protein